MDLTNQMKIFRKRSKTGIDKDDEDSVHTTLQNMVDKLGLKFGSVNVELVVDKNNRVWPIDVGPRAGGNMIPDLLGMIFGADVVEMAVLAAMGEQLNWRILSKQRRFVNV